MADKTDYRVEMIKICKSFGGIQALKGVTFNVRPGEIHCLVGENGAGKSTLMKILSGAYTRDSGEIKIDGNPIKIESSLDGKKAGIGIIYQEFSLAPDLSVAENIFINKLSRGKPIISWEKLYNDASKIIRSLGFNINPKTTVNDLSVAYQQIVEISKVLSEDIKVLVMDEPTAVLADYEVRKLFELIKSLKEKNISIIYISHRLNEVFELADKITVLRDGYVVNTVKAAEVNPDTIVNMMIGRKLSTMYPQRASKIGKEILKVENISNGKKVNNISFTLREGEILGIAGLVGSGKTETVRSIFGADVKESGNIYLDGNLTYIKSPYDAVKKQIGLVPENRKLEGIILSMSVKENISMPSIKKVLKSKIWIDRKKEKNMVKRLVERLNIKTPNINNQVANLSGGNQQKVAVAKWLGTESRVIFFDEPTRGVDVGAKVEVYNIINELSERGIGIVFISSEINEIVGMCDRVLVMHNGMVKGCLGKDYISEENIMKLAVAADLHN
jgi:ribose transport system ATP-binding protein